MPTESRRLSICVIRLLLIRGAAVGLAVILLLGAPGDDRVSAVQGAEHETTDANRGYALIYSGPSAGDDCPEAMAAVAKAAGLPVRFVDATEKIPELLKDAAVLVIGGTTGDLEPFRESFNPTTVRAIRRYLHDGGRYWGICGGAYLAAEKFSGNDGPVEALKLIPAVAVDHSENLEARLETVRWRGKNRSLYLEGSPKFILSDEEAAVEIIAYFEDDSIAALQCAYGNGKIAVSGPHPEARTSWLEHEGLETGDWTPTRPLAVAMLKDLLSDRPVRRKRN
jgi:glutamine amidotransferase-like uncharacterized protein